MRPHALLALALVACRSEEARDDASCAPCHAEIAAEHARSRHGNSLGSPVLQALIPRAKEAWGEAAGARCEQCHAPAQPKGEDAPHVGCVHCHGATGNSGERDGRLLVDFGKALAGSGDAKGAPHAVRAGGFLASSALCATCHEVTGPALFVETTGSEHVPVEAAGGDTCASCHAPPKSGRVSHGFVALSPGWGLSLEDAATRDAEAAALVAGALALDATLDGHTLTLRTTNVGAGHSVPTGVSFFRRIWVRVVARDPDGLVLWSSGEVDDSGRILSEPALSLGSELRKDGELVWTPTDADEVVPGSLAPGEERAGEVVLPPCPTSGCTVEVSLLARAFPFETLEVLGLSDRASEVPTLVARTLALSLPP